jgi:hypothetical protein
VSDHRARRRTALLRTAKSCGPDASTPASSLRRHVGPAGRGHAISADDGDKKARSPGRARNKPLKPLCAGMPGETGGPVVTNSCAFLFRTRGCGCIGHPAFPTPSAFQAMVHAQFRAHRAARSRTRVWNSRLTVSSSCPALPPSLKLRRPSTEKSPSKPRRRQVPGIHVLASLRQERRGWPGRSPAMTKTGIVLVAV